MTIWEIHVRACPPRATDPWYFTGRWFTSGKAAHRDRCRRQAASAGRLSYQVVKI